MRMFICLFLGLSTLLHHINGKESRNSILNTGNHKSVSPSISCQPLLGLRGGCSASFTSATLTPDITVDESQTVTPIASTNAHSMTKSDCLQSFHVDEYVGLSEDRVAVLREQYGRNSLPLPLTVPLWHLILEQFNDRLVQILLGVAVLSSFLAAIEKDVHAFTEPIIIISILTINAAVGVWQSKSAEDSLEALKRLQPETACVLREGVWHGEFPSADIVPGDIIYLRVGDKVPADARVISLKTTTFSTDESTLTGESMTVPKIIDPVDVFASIVEKSNTVFSGTMVANGGCYAVVVGTGKSTEIGKINAGVIAASVNTIKTPLAQKLDEFSAQLTKIIGVICVTVWIVSIPKFGSPVFGSWMRGAVYHAKIAVALGVAAIPEGLPAVITLCLSLGTRRLAKRNVVVRKLPSVETLGCTSVICTDKTGTLTTNQMTVKSLVTFSFSSDEKVERMLMETEEVKQVTEEQVEEVVGLNVKQSKFSSQESVTTKFDNPATIIEKEEDEPLEKTEETKVEKEEVMEVEKKVEKEEVKKVEKKEVRRERVVITNPHAGRSLLHLQSPSSSSSGPSIPNIEEEWPWEEQEQEQEGDANIDIEVIEGDVEGVGEIEREREKVTLADSVGDVSADAGNRGVTGQGDSKGTVHDVSIPVPTPDSQFKSPDSAASTAVSPVAPVAPARSAALKDQGKDIYIRKSHKVTTHVTKRVLGHANNTAEASLSLKEREVQGVSYEPVGAIEGLEYGFMDLDSVGDVAAICALCNDAQLEFKEGKFDRIGEPTEAALKVLVEKLGVSGMRRESSPMSMARQCSDHWAGKFEKLAVLEFDRDRKSMGVLCRPRTTAASSSADATPGSGNILFVKGAAEVVIRRCDRVKLEDGKIIPITPSIRAQLDSKLDAMAHKPLRNLALAFREGSALVGLEEVHDIESALSSPVLKDSSSFLGLESDMVLVGFCGIKDPARPEVAEAILKCTQAAVRIMMITGDSKATAVAIAREVNIFGILEDVTDSAYTSKEFFALPLERQLAVLKKGNKVFCRAEPKDKQILISMLEKLGEVTAMTGDGVNDASALKQADIGIAMGITGTEVAKAAADMILVDDNFASIVSAVEEGRNIYTNMQTFVTFLISCNIGEIATIFIATLMGLPEPLTPLHLLWVNLVTDGPPATALGFNPPDPDVMRRSPRLRTESILSRWLMIRYLITGLYVGFATIGVFVWWYADKGVPLRNLSRWVQCTEWPDFTHSASAPYWPDRPCDIFTVMKSVPQTMSLSVLVTIELLKALSAVSLDSSLLRVQPWQNPWLIPGVLIPFALHLLVVYIPPLAHIFSLSPLSWKEWKIVLLFASPIVLLEELLKYVSRNKTQLKEAAMSKFKEAQAHAQAHAPHRPKLPPPMF